MSRLAALDFENFVESGKSKYVVYVIFNIDNCKATAALYGAFLDDQKDTESRTGNVLEPRKIEHLNTINVFYKRTGNSIVSLSPGERKGAVGPWCGGQIGGLLLLCAGYSLQ